MPAHILPILLDTQSADVSQTVGHRPPEGGGAATLFQGPVNLHNFAAYNIASPDVVSFLTSPSVVAILLLLLLLLLLLQSQFIYSVYDITPCSSPFFVIAHFLHERGLK
jgi:hypothetical protein